MAIHTSEENVVTVNVILSAAELTRLSSGECFRSEIQAHGGRVFLLFAKEIEQSAQEVSCPSPA